MKTNEREAGVAPFNYFFQFKVPPKMYETILLTVVSEQADGSSEI